MIDIDYSLVIEATPDPAFFNYYSPDLNGFTGTGSSIEDCIFRAKGTIKNYLVALKSSGKHIPRRNDYPLITIKNSKPVFSN